MKLRARKVRLKLEFKKSRRGYWDIRTDSLKTPTVRQMFYKERKTLSPTATATRPVQRVTPCEYVFLPTVRARRAEEAYAALLEIVSKRIAAEYCAERDRVRKFETHRSVAMAHIDAYFARDFENARACEKLRLVAQKNSTIAVREHCALCRDLFN